MPRGWCQRVGSSIQGYYPDSCDYDRMLFEEPIFGQTDEGLKYGQEMTENRRLTKGNRAAVQPLVEGVVRVVRDHLHEEGLRMYLFGSWAQDRALRVSDLDIALEAGRPIDPAIMGRIVDALDKLPTLRSIDVVDLQAVDQEFRQAVLRQGELIYGN